MDFDKFLSLGLMGVLSLALLGGAACLFMCARSDGRVDYCRIVYHNENNVQLPIYVIEGHRNWRPDIRMAVATSAEEAEAKRKALCPQ